MTDEQKAAVRQRYERAVANLTDILQRDRTILAAVLAGSLAYDEVWEKSDIDLLLIGDETHKRTQFTLTDEGVIIHAFVTPRSAFKKMIEGSLQNSFLHSFIAKSRLLYTHDEALYGLYDNIQSIGSRDRTAFLLKSVTSVIMTLPKAEKWLIVKKDPHYTVYYILLCANYLATLEVVAAGELATREVLQAALRLNPTFFQRIYTDLIDGPKDEATLHAALATINTYLKDRTPLFFQPIFDYLAEAGGPRSSSEIDLEFKNSIQADGISLVCEWLSEQGIIEKVPLPLRLSPRSQVTVPEAGYYYDGGE